MKRIITWLMIIVLCLGFVGCEELDKTPSEIALKPGKFDIYDFAIYDTETEKQIYLGMAKKEIDAILGEAIQDGLIKAKYSYDGLEVAYRDDKVVSIKLSSNDLSKYDRYVTNRNIFLGVNKKDVIAVYGVDWEAEQSGNYIILRKNNEFVLLQNIKTIEDYKKYDTDNIFFISFLADADNNINCISICDYNYGMLLK